MLTFNGKTEKQLNLTVKEIRRSVMADIVPRLKNISGADGSRYFGSNLAALVIEVGFQAKSTKTFAELRSLANSVASWLYPVDKQLKTLTFDDEPTMKYLVVVEGSTAIDQLIAYGKFTVKFICPDGLKRGASFTWTTGTLTNTGSWSAKPVITVTFTAPTSSYKIQQVGGNYIRLVKNFIAGDVCIIDCEKKKITVNGVNGMQYWDMASRWFDLPVGASTYAMTPSTGHTTKIDYESRWL